MKTALSEITWVAIDPGDSRFSPTHIEGLIKSTAESLGISLDWLATNPITEGENRYGFLLASESDLTTLKSHVLEQLGSSISEHEESVIAPLKDQSAGRFIAFPSSLEHFDIHTPTDLIAQTAIEQVLAVGEPLPDDAVIATSDFLRPVLYEKKITLLVERLHTGDFAPIEKAHPHECCGGAHAPH
jgi:hypothetical protein